MKKLLLLSAILLLAACNKPATTTPETSTLSFRIISGGKTFTDFAKDPATAMNVVVVRTDLTQFEHLHPTMDAKGQWTIPHEFHAPGAYWLFADFTESSGAAHWMKFDRFAGTAPSPAIVWSEKTLNQSKSFIGKLGDMNVTILPTINGKSATFLYSFTDKDEKPVFPDPARPPFSVLIGPDASYQRLTQAGPLSFHAELPESGNMRLFTEITLNGKPYVVVSDLKL